MGDNLKLRMIIRYYEKELNVVKGTFICQRALLYFRELSSDFVKKTSAVKMANPDDMEMEKIAEDELAKLQRQFRVMEIDRATVMSSVQPTLRVQRNMIRTLNAELEKIMLELRVHIIFLKTLGRNVRRSRRRMYCA